MVFKITSSIFSQKMNRKLITFSVVFFVCLINLINAEMNKDKVVFALNCGGEEFEDSNGIVWVKVIIEYFFQNNKLIK